MNELSPVDQLDFAIPDAVQTKSEPGLTLGMACKFCGEMLPKKTHGGPAILFCRGRSCAKKFYWNANRAESIHETLSNKVYCYYCGDEIVRTTIFKSGRIQRYHSGKCYRNAWAYYNRDSTYNKRYMHNKRKAAIDLLGGKCARCGFSDIRALQIDHINGDGYKERGGRKGTNSHRIYNNILSGAQGYQCLCANCNWIKRDEEGEHGGGSRKPRIPNRIDNSFSNQRKIPARVISEPGANYNSTNSTVRPKEHPASRQMT
jgi:hypothetical protein